MLDFNNDKDQRTRIKINSSKFNNENSERKNLFKAKLRLRLNNKLLAFFVEIPESLSIYK